MKQADIQLKVDKFGSTVFLKNVTPAEVLYLVADNHANAGGDPIVELKETVPAMMTTTGPDNKEVRVPRSAGAELNRLRRKYRPDNLKKVFGEGFDPRMPQTFEEARSGGVGISFPQNNLIDHRLAL